MILNIQMQCWIRTKFKEIQFPSLFLCVNYSSNECEAFLHFRFWLCRAYKLFGVWIDRSWNWNKLKIEINVQNSFLTFCANQRNDGEAFSMYRRRWTVAARYHAEEKYHLHRHSWTTVVYNAHQEMYSIHEIHQKSLLVYGVLWVTFSISKMKNSDTQFYNSLISSTYSIVMVLSFCINSILTFSESLLVVSHFSWIWWSSVFTE